MQVIKNNEVLNLNSKILNYKKELKNNHLIKISTSDHTEHIAAYIAWCEVGGNIFVAPTTIENYNEWYDNELKKLEFENSILIPTSGTTRLPKIVVNQKEYFDVQQNLIKDWLNWNKDSVFLNLLPAFVSGFWYGFLPACVNTNSTMLLGSFSGLKQDLKSNASHITLVPNLIDMFIYKNIDLDLSNYDTCVVGASQVLDKHTKFLFEKNCKRLTHAYGSTEAGVPLLKYHSYSYNDDNIYLEYTKEYGIDTKLNTDGELLIKGTSLCANIANFDVDTEGWYHTGDIFEEVDGKIKFLARNNEIVKINGIKANLLLIESIIEETDEVHECTAKIKTKIGVDYVELNYVGNIQDTADFSKKLEKVLPKCNIPKKYIKVDAVSRNSFNKKLRY